MQASTKETAKLIIVINSGFGRLATAKLYMKDPKGVQKVWTHSKVKYFSK